MYKEIQGESVCVSGGIHTHMHTLRKEETSHHLKLPKTPPQKNPQKRPKMTSDDRGFCVILIFCLLFHIRVIWSHADSGLRPNRAGNPTGRSQPAAEVHLLWTNKRAENMSPVLWAAWLSYLEPLTV